MSNNKRIIVIDSTRRIILPSMFKINEGDTVYFRRSLLIPGAFNIFNKESFNEIITSLKSYKTNNREYLRLYRNAFSQTIKVKCESDRKVIFPYETKDKKFIYSVEEKKIVLRPIRKEV